MPTVVASGTQLATGAADTLYNSTLARTFQLTIDLLNMQAGDTTIVTIEIKAISAGTRRVVYQETFTDAQTEPDIIQISRPVPSPYEVLVSIEQTVGGLRNYEWAVVSLGAVTVEATGTLTTDGTEQTLATVTTNEVCVVITDHNNEAGGDTVMLRAKTRALAASADQVAFRQQLSGALADPDLIQISTPVSAPENFVGTAELTAGVNHDIPYAVVSLAS